MKKDRDSRFELLRIFAMLMIVMHHYVCHGNFDLPVSLQLNKIIVECAYWGGKVGINLFVLITGYWMIKSQWRVRKIFELWGQIFFYSVATTVVFACFGQVELSAGNVIKAVFPILFCRHNYTTTYMMLYTLVPFINIFINSLKKKQLDTLIITLFIILSVMPTFMGIYGGWTNNANSYLLWMIFVYIVGARIRLYGRKRSVKLWLSLAALSIAIIWGLTVICGELQFIDTYYIAAMVNGIPIFISSIIIFKVFDSITIGHSKIINTVAKSTLAVYLIHDDVYFRNYVWDNIFEGNVSMDSGVLIINIFLTTIIVFGVCILIDKVRLLTFHKIYMMLLDKIFCRHLKS